MIKVQIYIENELIDLYGDESIEVNSSIQDIKDVGKVFTDFSQSFKVPASSKNNIVFGHFYNNKLTQGGYDTRNKRSAKIFINYVEFRKGYVQLNGVQMKNNKPSSYDIVFFGSTVRLKDLIKDDKLTALCDINKDYNLSNYNHDYNNSTIKNHAKGAVDYTVEGDTHQSAIIYPLITGKKRLFFDSSLSDSDEENYGGNVYSVGTDTTRGISYEDLKPAIKAIHVIEAIEGHYGIEFTRDFFDTEAFSPLYLWLSSASGNIVDYKFVGEEKKIIQITNLGNADLVDSTISIGSSTFSQDHTISDNDTIDFTMPVVLFNKAGFKVIEVAIEPTNANANYTIKAIDTITGDVVGELSGSGDQTLKMRFKYSSRYSSRDYSIKLVVETYVGITFTASVSIERGAFNMIGYATNFVDANSGSSFSTTETIEIETHLPDLKVIDFLSGIFKMFNLVAFYIDDETDSDFGKIKVMTLDDFYADAANNPSNGIIDIKKYVDVSQHYIAASLPYSSISFKYEETPTVTMEHHTLDYNEVFGNSEYTPDDFTDSGKKYEIKLPFSHMKYEHLLDLGDELEETGIQYGYAAGGDFDPETGNYNAVNIKPLLFYGILETGLPASKKINWISGTEDALASYWRPSNSNKLASKTTPAPFNINFDTEFDEFYLTDYSFVNTTEEEGFEQQDDQNSLFKNFYSKYIVSTFDPTKRILKLKAHFPASLLTRYKLNDQFKIQDEVYRINSIKTNINTGKTELELLSLNVSEIIS